MPLDVRALAELNALYKDGVLTKEEFEQAKGDLVAAMGVHSGTQIRPRDSAPVTNVQRVVPINTHTVTNVTNNVTNVPTIPCPDCGGDGSLQECTRDLKSAEENCMYDAGLSYLIILTLLLVTGCCFLEAGAQVDCPRCGAAGRVVAR